MVPLWSEIVSGANQGPVVLQQCATVLALFSAIVIVVYARHHYSILILHVVLAKLNEYFTHSLKLILHPIKDCPFENFYLLIAYNQLTIVIHCKRPGLFQLSLVTSVTIRKHIKTSMYRETLLTSMGLFGDKKGTLWWQVFKWPLVCEAFNGHFGNKQTRCKLLKDNRTS